MGALISTEQQAILGLLSKNIFGKSYIVDENIDWENVCKESRAQSVLPLIFAHSNDFNVLPQELKTKVETAILKNTNRTIHNRRCHAYLHKLMTDAGIEYCILKGVTSAHYYPEPLLRPMGDVDFYVSPENIPKACEVLEKDGFVTEDKFKPGEGHHLVYKKTGYHFEMHYEITGVPHSKMGETISYMFSDICDKSMITNDEFVTFMMPSKFHHGLVMLLHLQNHMIIEGVGLRHLCDWAVFVNSFEGYEFAEIFSTKLKTIGLWKFCNVLTHACSIYLSMPEPEWLDDTDITATKAFIGEILSSGNFGKKRENIRYEGMIMSVQGRDRKKFGPIAKGFKTLNRIARDRWPFLKKLPFLYPIAWIYFIVRLFVLITIGKRPNLKIMDSIQNSNKRNKFYDGLKLFEPEE